MLLLDVVQTLESDAIPFVIIGSWADALQGEPLLPGAIEIAIPHTRREFIRTEKSLYSLALESTLPISAGQVYDFREEFLQNRGLEFWEFIQVSKPRNRVRISLRHESPEMVVHTIYTRTLTIPILTKESGNRRNPDSEKSPAEAMDALLARLEIQEAFRTRQTDAGRSKLISVKVPEILLENFKRKAKQQRVPYQTQLKRLMADWLTKS